MPNRNLRSCKRIMRIRKSQGGSGGTCFKPERGSKNIGLFAENLANAAFRNREIAGPGSNAIKERIEAAR